MANEEQKREQRQDLPKRIALKEEEWSARTMRETGSRILEQPKAFREGTALSYPRCTEFNNRTVCMDRSSRFRRPCRFGSALPFVEEKGGTQ